MTTSLLNECLKLRLEPSDRMLEYLHSINLHIFDDLFQNRETDYDPRHAVLYILTAYSEDSPLIILRQDSRVEQENICDYLGIPELYRHNFINLVDKSIRRAVTNYVHSFSSQTFRWLMFAKIQYRDYEMIVTNRDFKVAEGDTNTYNYSMPDHNKAVMAMYSLAKAISQCEKEISQEVKRKGSILEMEEVKSDGKGKNGRKRFNGSIENIIK